VYKIEVTGTNLYQLNRAIQSGFEKGQFLLPKGPSGKVKLSAKSKTSASKEVGSPSHPCLTSLIFVVELEACEHR
jgi:histone H1/5